MDPYMAVLIMLSSACLVVPSSLTVSRHFPPSSSLGCCYGNHAHCHLCGRKCWAAGCCHVTHCNSFITESDKLYWVLCCILYCHSVLRYCNAIILNSVYHHMFHSHKHVCLPGVLCVFWPCFMFFLLSCVCFGHVSCSSCCPVCVLAMFPVRFCGMVWPIFLLSCVCFGHVSCSVLWDGLAHLPVVLCVFWPCL